MKKQVLTNIVVTIIILGLFSLSSSAFLIKNNGHNEKNQYALLVGYGGKSSIITKNAEKMKNLLLKYSWKQENIKTVMGLEATKNNILTSISGWLDEKEGIDDDILIYFSIHGGRTDEDGVLNGIDLDEPDNREEFIQPVEFVLRHPGYPFTPFECDHTLAILDDELGVVIDLLDSNNIAVIFESCYSGGMIDGDLDLAEPGRIVLTSSSKDELSWFNKMRCSYFTHHLMNGLDGEADKNENGGNVDGNVSVQEAFYYAKPKTEEDAKRYKDMPQTPQMYDGCNSEFNIIDLSKEKEVQTKIKSEPFFKELLNCFFKSIDWFFN